MNSKKIELASNSPYVRGLTLAVIKSIRRRNLVQVREIVHSDLVPKFHERVIHASFGQRTIPPRKNIFVPKIIPPSRTGGLMPSIMNIPKAPVGIETHAEGYGKINNLLNDPSVSSIECSGPSKRLTIIRLGQKQTTNIELNQAEIKEILDKIADKAHVPLSEGVFRAAVDNFSINAVISDIIGSKFIIKKNTPYSMLER